MSNKNVNSDTYAGIRILDIMSFAKNYNNFLSKNIRKYETLTSNSNKIIDFGAGLGQFSFIYKDEINFYAIEEDINFCKILNKKNIKTASLESLNDESIDYIYTINVLEHIKEDQMVLNELFKKLKKGGGIYIYVPAFNFLWTPLDNEVGHYRRYTRREIFKKLKNAGFQKIEVEYADSAGFFATLIFKLFSYKPKKVSVKTIKIFDKYIFPVGRVFDSIIFKYLFGKNISTFAKKSK